MHLLTGTLGPQPVLHTPSRVGRSPRRIGSDNCAVMSRLMHSWDKAHPCGIRNLFSCIGSSRVKLILHKRQQVAPVIMLEIAENL